jgi:hypothetical protein
MVTAPDGISTPGPFRVVRGFAIMADDWPGRVIVD